MEYLYEVSNQFYITLLIYIIEYYRNWSYKFTHWLRNASNNIHFITFLCGFLCIYHKTIEYITIFHPLCIIYTTKTICNEYFSIAFFLGEGFGACFNFILTDTLGRQKTLLYTLVVYGILCSWLVFDMNNTYLFNTIRFCCGYGVGIIESVVPLFAAGK